MSLFNAAKAFPFHSLSSFSSAAATSPFSESSLLSCLASCFDVDMFLVDDLIEGVSSSSSLTAAAWKQHRDYDDGRNPASENPSTSPDPLRLLQCSLDLLFFYFSLASAAVGHPSGSSTALFSSSSTSTSSSSFVLDDLSRLLTRYSRILTFASSSSSSFSSSPSHLSSSSSCSLLPRVVLSSPHVFMFLRCLFSPFSLSAVTDLSRSHAFLEALRNFIHHSVALVQSDATQRKTDKIHLDSELLLSLKTHDSELFHSLQSLLR